MKKVFSLWFMDIAKYVVTALVLSTVFTDVVSITSRWVFYSVALLVITAIILLGVLFFKSAEKEERENKKYMSNN